MRTREEVLQYALSFPNVYEERPFRNQGSVSYTHLDVYKRQVSDHAISGICTDEVITSS